MCNNFPNIKVVEGNAFSVLVPLKVRTFESCRPIDEDIDPTKLSNVVFKFGGVSYTPIVDERGVAAVLPATLARGTYDIVVTADYEDNPIRAAYEGAITIVPWNSQSDAQQYLPGSPIVLEAAYIIGGALTDAELEALKEEYREKNAQLDQAIADAEEAKREWEQKAADLDGVAQEQTLTDGVTAIRDDISHIDIDTSTLAKQGTDATATNTAIYEALSNIVPSQEAIGQSYAILEQKGVPVPPASEQTAVNLPNTISQINEAFVGTVYTNSLPRINAIGCENFNYKAVTLVPSFSMQGAFQNYYYVKRIIGMNYAGNNMQSFCQGASALEYLDMSEADFSGVTLMTQAFYQCGVLEHLDMRGADLRSCTSFNSALRYSYSLRWIDFSGTKVGSSFTASIFLNNSTYQIQTLVGDLTIDQVINNNVCVFEGCNVGGSSTWNWDYAPYLNRASLRAIINGLADKTGGTTMTLKLGATNLAKLTADDIAVATNKNWTLA